MTDDAAGSAAAEIARTLRPAFTVLPNLFGKIAGPASEELGLWLRDEVAAVRRRRLERLDAMLAEELAARAPANAIAAPPVDAVYLLDVLDAASRAGDDVVTRLWAKLLASNVGDEASRHPLFVRALTSMSKDDALVFENYCAEDRPELAMPRVRAERARGRLLDSGLLAIPRPYDESTVFGRRSLDDTFWPYPSLSRTGEQLAEALGLREPPAEESA